MILSNMLAACYEWLSLFFMIINGFACLGWSKGTFEIFIRDLCKFKITYYFAMIIDHFWN